MMSLGQLEMLAGHPNLTAGRWAQGLPYRHQTDLDAERRRRLAVGVFSHDGKDYSLRPTGAELDAAIAAQCARAINTFARGLKAARLVALKRSITQSAV